MSLDRPHQNRLLGIGLRVGATTCFAFMAAMIKLGHEAGVSIVELTFYRFAFGLPPLLLWILWSRNFDAWRTERPLAHAWRAAAGLTTMVLAFSALRYLPLAESTTIGFAAPLFAVILSALVLGEKVGRHRWSAVVIGFLGVVVVTRPGGAELPPLGLTLAILAAFGVGVTTITIRQIGRTEGTQTTVLWFSVLSMTAIGALMPFHARFHDGGTWLILLALGGFGGVAQLLLTASLRYAAVPVVVPFDYTQLLWAVLLGWLIFADAPPTTTWVGAAVIIVSGLYTLYREHRLGREKAADARPALGGATDQALGHRVGDFGRVPPCGRALGPDLVEADRYLLDPRADRRLVPVLQILGGDVDDAARVDHVIGGVEDSALVDALAVGRNRELVVGAAGDDRHPKRGDRLLGEDGAERVGAEHVGLEGHDRLRIDDAAADLASQPLGAAAVDVGEADPRALLGRTARYSAGDASRALDGDVETLERVLAERSADGRLDSEEDPVAGVRPGIAADGALPNRKPGDVSCVPGDADQIGNGDPDVLGGDVASAQPFDRPAVGVEHLGSLGSALVGEDHCLAAAQRKASHGVLEAHSAREPKSVADGLAGFRIMPETDPARSRPERSGMDGYDGAKAGRAVRDEMDDLVIVEVGIVPEGMH
jgi:drug/metabolite transporter (DMT)-like permease